MLTQGKVFWSNPHHVQHPLADGRLECDFLIVGGGISGVMTAYLLATHKLGSVVLVERDLIGSGATGASAGMIVKEFEGVDFDTLAMTYGNKATRAYWKAHSEMYDMLKGILKEEKFECDMREGDIYIVSRNEEQKKKVTEDISMRRKLGVNVLAVDQNLLLEDIRLSGFNFGEKVEKGLSVNPVKLVQGLAEAAVRKGVRIFENSSVTKMGEGIAYTAHSEIRFKTTIVVTDSFGPENPIDTFRTSIGLTRQLTRDELEALRLDDFDMVVESESRGYHYLKVTHDRRILIGFGDELVSIGDKAHLPIAQHVIDMNHFAKEIFPQTDLAFEHVWTGTYGLSKNLIPHLSFSKSKIVMCGAGLQLTSMMMTKFIVDRLRNKGTLLDCLYK